MSDTSATLISPHLCVHGWSHQNHSVAILDLTPNVSLFPVLPSLAPTRTTCQCKRSQLGKCSHFQLTTQSLPWPCSCAPHRPPSGRPQHGSPGLLSGSWISQWTCKIHFRYFFSMIVHTSISPKEWVSCALYACGSPQQESSGRQDLPSPSGESPRCPPGPFSRIFKNQDPVESNNQS